MSVRRQKAEGRGQKGRNCYRQQDEVIEGRNGDMSAVKTKDSVANVKSNLLPCLRQAAPSASCLLPFFKQYAIAKDVATRNLLVTANHNLARKEAHAIAAVCGEPYEDLEQEAVLGLIKSVENFNPDKGVAFSSYAVPYIHGKLLQYLRDKGHLIRLSQSTQTLINRSKKTIRDLSQELGRIPTSKEVASKLNLPLEKYESIKSANRCVSAMMALDSELNEDTVYYLTETPQPKLDNPVVQIDWSNLSQGELATLRRKKGDRRKVWKSLAHESTKATAQS